MLVHQVDWEKIPWRTIRPGIERKAFTGDRTTLALHRISPGHTLAPHSHPHEQIVTSSTARSISTSATRWCGSGRAGSPWCRPT